MSEKDILKEILKKLEKNDVFQEDVKKELKSLNNKFDGLETRFDGLETRFDGLETRFDGLETRFDGLETKFDGLRDDFREFSSVQELEHRATRKLINQAFERIDENILYQEKVDRMERMLRNKKLEVI